jgi:hypothetical protein
VSVPSDYRERYRAEQAARADAARQAAPDKTGNGRQVRPSQPPADGSRWAMLNTFVDQSLRGRSRSELAVWFVLYRDTCDGTARTGMADIARRAGCHRGSVVRAVQSLQARGLVRVVRRGRKNGGTSVYVVCGAAQDAQDGPKPR